MADPRLPWIWSTGAVLVLGTAALTALARWAWQPVPEPTLPEADLEPVAAASASATIDPRDWQQRLWQPLRDPPPPPPPERRVPPLPVELVAITERGGNQRAVLAWAEAGLQTLAEGDSRDGLTVLRIDAGQVALRWHGQEQTLELAP